MGFLNTWIAGSAMKTGMGVAKFAMGNAFQRAIVGGAIGGIYSAATSDSQNPTNYASDIATGVFGGALIGAATRAITPALTKRSVRKAVYQPGTFDELSRLAGYDELKSFAKNNPKWAARNASKLQRGTAPIRTFQESYIKGPWLQKQIYRSSSKIKELKKFVGKEELSQWFKNNPKWAARLNAKDKGGGLLHPSNLINMASQSTSIISRVGMLAIEHPFLTGGAIAGASLLASQTSNPNISSPSLTNASLNDTIVPQDTSSLTMNGIAPTGSIISGMKNRQQNMLNSTYGLVQAMNRNRH